MRSAPFLTVLLPMSLCAQQGSDSTRPPQDPFRFEYVGPPSAGRIASVAGVPGDPSAYYAGAASGGIWKTTDSGRTFTPIFVHEPVQAIGALAAAPAGPKIASAGTGEAWAVPDAALRRR